MRTLSTINKLYNINRVEFDLLWITMELVSINPQEVDATPLMSKRMVTPTNQVVYVLVRCNVSIILYFCYLFCLLRDNMQHIGCIFCTSPCNSVHNRWCFWAKQSWITCWFNLDSFRLTLFVQANKLNFEQTAM